MCFTISHIDYFFIAFWLFDDFKLIVYVHHFIHIWVIDEDNYSDMYVGKNKQKLSTDKDIFWFQDTILIMLYDHNAHLLSSPVCHSCWADITGTWQNIFTGALWRQSPLEVCDLNRFLGILVTKTMIINFIQKCRDFCKLRLHFL